ncbi:hypothetical protein [Bacillus sp. SI2]|uniref:hypothetical protein n=1 Tax=Bacillus sp. SI2 TaxID=3077323 RepID=UPI0028E8745C|nr:hypothetical protein [Bacillus sp. SI2]WNV20009.1 hypothetical protein RS401_00875 [Bacillus sp. SI2]
MEEVKRLAPKKAVLRELYLKSGNRCAFPDCQHSILNDKGLLVGEICHIEAAMPGGERFNPNQTNEERRAASNLVLLCHEHHIETNDVKKYTVKRLKKMKRDHEKKYSDVADKLFSSIADKTKLQEYEYCHSLKKYNKVLDLSLDKETRLEIVDEFNELVDKFRKLSPDTRGIFRIMLERAKELSINIDDVREVTGISINSLSKHVWFLEENGLIAEPEQDERGIIISSFSCDLWPSIKQYAERSAITLEEIIDSMDFSLLD